MAAPTTEEDPRHAQFLDLCLLYGDFNRPVFLEAILQSFIESASPTELKSLRRAIRDRENALRRNGRKGRPRAEESWDWLCSTLKLVWQRDIEGWSWSKIALANGIKPTGDNIRTLQKRRDLYAMLVWRALPGRTDNRKELMQMLNRKALQLLLRSRVALPFDTHPEECRKIVLALASRGLGVAGNELNRFVNRRIAARSRAIARTRK